MRLQAKILSAAMATLLLAGLAGCSTKTSNQNQNDQLSQNQNRQFENNYTSNNPVDKSNVP